MTGVAAPMAGPLLQKDGCDSNLEILKIKRGGRRRGRLLGGRFRGLRCRERTSRTNSDRYHKTRRNFPCADIRNHVHSKIHLAYGTIKVLIRLAPSPAG